MTAPGPKTGTPPVRGWWVPNPVARLPVVVTPTGVIDLKVAGQAVLPVTVTGAAAGLAGVLFDAVGAGLANTTVDGTVKTWSHTVANGSGVMVVCAVSMYANAAGGYWTNLKPSAVTFGGQPMTLAGEMTANNQDTGVVLYGGCALYTLLNPNNRGAQTVSVTFPDTIYTPYAWANTVSYTGVASAGTAVTAYGNSTNPSTGAVASAANHRVVSVCGTSQVAVSAPTQTSRYTQSGTSLIYSGYVQDAAGAATVTTGCTAASARWSTVAIDLSP